MARRLQCMSENQQTLKKGYKRNVIFSPIQRIIPLLRRKPQEYDVECGAIHDLDNSLIRFKASLTKAKGQIAIGANCVFRIYEIDKALMTETLVYTVPTVSETNSEGYFITAVSEANLGSEFIGEVDYIVEVEIQRIDRTFKKRFYFNALGIYDFALRIKKKVTFLEITKKSVGE